MIMSSPMPASAFLDALRDEGLSVAVYPGWAEHNRNHMGPWGPVHGVMIHHTVTWGTANTVRICRDGYSGLPGPLCHGVIAKDGKIHLIGYGRANHAGLGDPDVLAAVIAEVDLPADDQATVDGNRHFYGFECENLGDGKDPWPTAQLQAIEQAAAAICRYHNWTAASAIRHLDWQPGKIDPLGVDWTKMQDRIDARLGVDLPRPEPIPPQKPVVVLSKLSPAARTDSVKSGTPVSYPGTKIVEAALVDEGLLARRYSDGHYGTTTITAMSRWQERCGYKGRERGQAADGYPGLDSLTRLGLKHGFTVIK